MCSGKFLSCKKLGRIMDPQDQTSLGFEVDADCLSAVQAAEASDDGECSQDSGSSKSPSKRSGKKKNKVKKNGK